MRSCKHAWGSVKSAISLGDWRPEGRPVRFWDPQSGESGPGAGVVKEQGRRGQMSAAFCGSATHPNPHRSLTPRLQTSLHWTGWRPALARMGSPKADSHTRLAKGAAQPPSSG